MDYKSVFTNLCLELQQNRSWIKGLGKNPFTHSIPFTHSLTAVPFVRGHRSVFPRTPRNTGVYTRHPTFVTATSGVLTRLPAWLSKNRMRVYTLSDMRSKKKLRVYTASEAKGLNVSNDALTSVDLYDWFGFINCTSWIICMFKTCKTIQIWSIILMLESFLRICFTILSFLLWFSRLSSKSVRKWREFGSI